MTVPVSYVEQLTTFGAGNLSRRHPSLGRNGNRQPLARSAPHRAIALRMTGRCVLAAFCRSAPGSGSWKLGIRPPPGDVLPRTRLRLPSGGVGRAIVDSSSQCRQSMPTPASPGSVRLPLPALDIKHARRTGRNLRTSKSEHTRLPGPHSWPGRPPSIWRCACRPAGG